MRNASSNDQPRDFAVLAVGAHARVTVCVSEPVAAAARGLCLEVDAPPWEFAVTVASLDEVRALIKRIKASEIQSDRVELTLGFIDAVPLRVVCNDGSPGRMTLIVSFKNGNWISWRPDVEVTGSIKAALYDLLKDLAEQG